MFILGDFPPSSPNCDTIRIPRLSSLVRGVIDKPGFSFGAYMKTQAGGPTEVHSWIGSVFAKFRELELQLIIGQLEFTAWDCQEADRGSRPIAQPRRGFVAICANALRKTQGCAPARLVF